MSENKPVTTVSCIAYESIWVPTYDHQRHLGGGSLKREDRQEENEEIQRRDQGPRNPAYDETKHSNELENDRGSH